MRLARLFRGAIERSALASIAACVILGGTVGAAAAPTFYGESQAAMHRMMDGMSAPSSNDADRDFAQMMIVHHQGAIDMAVLELRHGRDERLRRLAQQIIVEQQQQIAVINLAVAELPSTGTSASSESAK